MLAALAISERARADIPYPVSHVVASASPFATIDTYGTTSLSASATDSASLPDPWSYTAAASVITAPEPRLTASVFGSGYNGEQGLPSATAQLTYDFTVIAPIGATPAAQVPIDISLALFSTLSANDIFDTAGFVTVTAPGDLFTANICAPGQYQNCSGGLFFGGVNPFGVVPYALITVNMFAGIDLVFPGSSNFSGDVSIDPLFNIDPAFLAANPGYTLEFSPGIGNSAAGVPELGTWMLMLVGLGGLGVAQRTMSRVNKRGRLT